MPGTFLWWCWVNEYSASGSEVLAGAIRDNDRASIIGTVTFGKGSVNTLRKLSDGSGIFFTIAHWHTPSGTLIEGDGLEPDIVVEQTGGQRRRPPVGPGH